MAPSLTGRRPWALSPYSCPLNSSPSRASSGIKFRAPSRRSVLEKEKGWYSGLGGGGEVSST